MRVRTCLACLVTMGCSVVLDADRHNGDSGLLGDAVLADTREAILPEELCDEIARPFCEAKAACCDTFTVDDVPACVVEFKAGCNATIGMYVLDPRLGFNEEAAQDVLDRFVEVTDSCDVDDTIAVFLHGLLTVIDGTVSRGGTCTPSLMDVIPAVSCIDTVCLSDGLFNPWTCGDPRSDGAPCVTYLECERGLRCDARSFTCASLLSNGAECQSSTDCESQFCRRVTAGEDGACASPSVECRCATPTNDEIFCGPIPEFIEIPNGMMRDG